MMIKEAVTKHKKRVIAGAVAIAICAMAVTALPAMAASPSSTDAAVYKESPVQRGDVTIGINETGTASLEAIAMTYDDYSSVSSSDDSTSVKATVEEVYVKAGQQVKEGDAIAKLSTDDIEESLNTLQQQRKEAQLMLDKARIDQQSGEISAKTTLEKRLSDAENADLNYDLELDQNANSIASLKSAMYTAQERYETAEDELNEFQNREKTLNSAIAAAVAAGDTDLEQELRKELTEHKKNYTSNRQKYYAAYSSAANTLSSAELKYEIAVGSDTLNETTAENNRKTALSYSENAQKLYDLEIAQLTNSVSSKALSVENLDTKIKKLQSYLNDGQVKATCDGLVMNVYVVAGDKVNANATLATVANSKNIYLSVAIDQEDISTLALGKSANIALDAFPDQKLTGKVDSMSTTPAMGNSSTVSYNIKVRLDEPIAGIYEGMTGSVTFVTEEVKDVITVSSKAVYTEGDKKYVKVKSADGTIVPVEVETGMQNGVITEITSGLAEGDVAIIESKVRATK